MKKKIIEKIKSFLLEPNFYVQEQAIRFLVKNYPNDSSIPDLILKSVDFYLGDNYWLLHHLAQFKLNETSIYSLLSIMKKDIPPDILFSLINSFIKEDVEVEILEKLLDEKLLGKKLTIHLKSAISIRKFLAKKNCEQLWTMLRDFCEKNNEKFVNKFDYNYGIQICNKLKQYSKVKDILLKYFKKEFTGKTLLDIYVIYLAGVIKLKNISNFLLDAMDIDDETPDLYNEMIVEAVGRIKDQTVLKRIKKQFFKRTDIYQSYAAEIFTYFPTLQSEKILLYLLKNTDDKNIKTSLAISLCEIFSKKGIEPIIEMIENDEYDYELTDLRKEILGTLKLYRSDEYINYYESCMKIVLYDDNIFKITLPGGGRKIGRNSPCPCGSGKKYKHCCLPKGIIYHSTTDIILSYNIIIDKLMEIGVEYEYLILEFLLDFIFPFKKIDFISEIYKNSNIRQFLDTYFNQYLDEFPLVIESLVFDYPVLGGDITIFDYFFTLNQSTFSSKGLSFIEEWRDSYLWLYSIIDIDSENSRVKVQRWFDDNKYNVISKELADIDVKGDIIFGRLLKVDEQNYVLGKSALFLSQKFSNLLHDILSNTLSDKLSESSTPEDFKSLGRMIYLIMWYIKKVQKDILKFTLPRKVTLPTGEEFIISTVKYEVHNYEKIKQFLDKNFLIVEDEKENLRKICYIWNADNPNLKYPDIKKFKSKDEVFNLGKIFLSKDILMLETRSKKSLSVLKQFIENNLGKDDVRFLKESFISWEEIVKERLGEDKDTLSESLKEAGDDSAFLSHDEETKLFKEYKRGFYEAQLNEKIPMLGNMSPYECIKTENGKKKVKEWLNQLETEEKLFVDEDARIDFTFLYKKLGIKK